GTVLLVGKRHPRPQHPRPPPRQKNQDRQSHRQTTGDPRRRESGARKGDGASGDIPCRRISSTRERDHGGVRGIQRQQAVAHRCTEAASCSDREAAESCCFTRCEQEDL
ncbi:UPF0235 protein VC0458, partial [Sideroxydans sp. CL21]